MRTPEAIEKDRISRFLDAIPNLWYFRPFMAGFGKSGVGDIIGCYRGDFFSIEVKREGKQPTPIQVRRMDEIDDAGGFCFAGTADAVIPEFKKRFSL